MEYYALVVHICPPTIKIPIPTQKKKKKKNPIPARRVKPNNNL